MAAVVLLAACAKPESGLPPSTAYSSQTSTPETYNYQIGPGDQLQIFVWRNPEVSQTVTVRPDGKITTPLVEDLQASGKTPNQLARDLEKALETYIRQPIVTVIVAGGIGPYSEQIRVIGQVNSQQSTSTDTSRSAGPRAQAIAYRQKMTLLDVMVAVGGLSEFADGNRTKVVRIVEGKQQEYQVRLNDLLNGDITANVDMLPGDILIVPESWF
ncbi:MAG: polysaccharide export protein [Candidatus Competibacter sp.]|nr:polysaccharide biosynthesis/export family protein [Candidatus Competibacteraceae bacterium]MBK7982650.1 polysaccharide biosynthesis/export family protein [Candidatus Competibacteraceae bacterium]MBK8962600.1 polysaccharide biosynthesis/export family protein [Candidatus Competibacteraceae bacterium]